MDKLTGLTAFVHTAQTQSFVVAGRQLGLSASAVGKSVARLEQRLGVRLFQRSTRRIRLTAEGELFYNRCRHILNDFDEAEAMLSYAVDAPRGTLRLSVAVMAYHFLMPALREFRLRYPEIVLDLDFDDRIVDLIGNGLDAVIRSGPLSDSSLKARRIGSLRAMVYASPDYLQRHGVPQRPHDLERHACLRFRNHMSGQPQPWKMQIDVGMPEPRLPAAMICNNIEAMLAAAIHGLGCAYMPTFVARNAVTNGTLTPLLDGYMIEHDTFWILWSSNHQMTPKLRAFIDFVCEGMPGLE